MSNELVAMFVVVFFATNVDIHRSVCLLLLLYSKFCLEGVAKFI